MKKKKAEDKILTRPQVADFTRPAEFLKALHTYHKKHSRFSLSQRIEGVGTISQSLVSLILNGRRSLTSENLEAVANIFKLTDQEKEALDGLVQIDQVPPSPPRVVQKVRGRETKNHILSDWLNPYVKDLISLQGFAPEPRRLFKMLSGLAPQARIGRSIDFLLKEGFWIRNENGQVVPEDHAVISTVDIPSSAIRDFHKKALDIAKDGLAKFPTTKRKASTFIISLDKDKLEDLRKILEDFENQLSDFAERNQNGKDHLVQVVAHLTPVGIGLEPKPKNP